MIGNRMDTDNFLQLFMQTNYNKSRQSTKIINDSNTDESNKHYLLTSQQFDEEQTTGT